MAGNLRNWGNPLIRGCMTQNGRILYDLKNRCVVNGTGGTNSNEYSFSRNKTEKPDNSMRVIGSSRNINGDYNPYNPLQYRLRSQMLGLDAVQGTTGGSTYYDEQEPSSWWNRGDLGTGEHIVTENGIYAMQQEYKTIYDATIKKHGSWDAARNALSKEVKKVFSGIGTFLYDWGKELAEFLLTKAPFPPHIKTAIAVGFFMKAVYDIVEEVHKKRKAGINEIKAQNPDWEQWEPWELEEKANESLDAWVIQAVGEKAIGEMLGKTAEESKLNGVAQTALSTAWNRFVAEAKAGRWERRTR